MGSKWLCVVALVACGGGGSHHDGDGGNGSGSGDAGVPAPVCTAPPLGDTSSPTATVGTGTAASCTNSALQTAANGGGTIVFNCGSAPVTIAITQTVMFAKDTILDGGNLVTLDGGGATRILYLNSNYNTKTPRLTVQRLAFHAGLGPASGGDTARGGGAIYRNGGSITVIDSTFDDNHAGQTGQDLAGGAIYGFGGGDTTVAGSTFTNNSASDGGAIGSLNGDLTIVNSTFTGNSATGTGGNPGNGGAGGALYMDGTHEMTSLCGITISGSTAGAIGGGFFRVSNDHTGSFAMDRSTVDGNQIVMSAAGNAGGLYLEGLAISITNSTISNNSGGYNGGVWIDMGSANLTNVTIANNTATASNGGGVWLANSPTGTMLNCTVANNKATAAGQVSGAIFGTGLTLQNTIIANNTAQYDPSCEAPPLAGTTGNLQWPSGSLCTMSPLVADPKLGALANNGGTTQTMLPASGSPAIGIGHGCPPTDQRGNPRSDPCTAGAVEP
jgi:parallel beta-helix repeat protein